MAREPCRRFRDRLARVTPGCGHPESDRWCDFVTRLATDLDRLHDLGAEARPEARVFRAAWRAFLPLADPGWWRAHPPARLNHQGRRLLRRLGKKRRRAARRPQQGLMLRLADAIAIYARAGDGDGIERCRRLAAAFAEAEAGR